MDIFDKLAAPFPPEKVSWRVGSTNKDKTKGMALAYIDARDVMQRLDEVVGPANWQRRYSHAEKKTICEIDIRLSALMPDVADGRVSNEWVTKADGAGDSDIEAEKGAISDAFKRAAVNWGIGRYLYDIDSPWVSIEPVGNSYRIQEGEYAKLRTLLSKAPYKAVSQPVAQSVPSQADKSKRVAAETAMSRIRTTLSAMDSYQQAEWAKDFKNAKDIEAIHRLKDAYPDLYEEIKGTGFEV